MYFLPLVTRSPEPLIGQLANALWVAGPFPKSSFRVHTQKLVECKRSHHYQLSCCSSLALCQTSVRESMSMLLVNSWLVNFATILINSWKQMLSPDAFLCLPYVASNSLDLEVAFLRTEIGSPVVNNICSKNYNLLMTKMSNAQIHHRVYCLQACLVLIKKFPVMRILTEGKVL